MPKENNKENNKDNNDQRKRKLKHDLHSDISAVMAGVKMIMNSDSLSDDEKEIINLILTKEEAMKENLQELASFLD